MQYETIRIDCSNIFDVESFHPVFAATCGFPSCKAAPRLFPVLPSSDPRYI
jgi:hypothetical protein